ncbi:MAG: ATP-binding protein [Bacilli bacterium]
MKIVKVVLTGGPGGGKTSVLNAIKNLAITEEGYKNIIKLGDKKIKLVTISETATELISSGITPTEAERIYDFQDILFEIQKSKEESSIKSLRFGYDADVILFLYDRGLLDGMAYLDKKGEFEDIMASKDVKELDILDKYDLVVDLLSTATCAPEKYGFESNEARFEDVEWAKSVDRKTSAAWVGHRNMKLFDSGVSLEEEVNNVIEYLKDYILNGSNIEKEEYFIENSPVSFSKYNDVNSRRINVVNTHIDFGIDNVVDTILVKRTYRGYSTYFLQFITKGSEKARIIKDERIDENTYKRLLTRYDIKDIEEKKELSFVEGKHLYKVSFYNDFTTLEVEKGLDNEEIIIPNDIKIIRKIRDFSEKSELASKKVLKKDKNMLL